MGNKASSSRQELRAPKNVSDIDNTDEGVTNLGKSSSSTIPSREEDIQSGNTGESDRATTVRSLLTLQFEGGYLERRQRKEAKMSISALETELGLIVAEQNYQMALDKLFEILFLSKKAFGNKSNHTAYTLHRMSSVLCLLGRLEEALKYESESCAIRKALTADTGPNSMIGKSLVYIAKLLWHFNRYLHGFHAILEAYNIAEQIQTNQVELRGMVGSVALEMSDIAHQSGYYHLAFKLKILSFQSRRAAFLQEDSQFDENLIALSRDLWNYKDGVMLVNIIPQISKVELTCKGQYSDEEDNCPICFGEFTESDSFKTLLCDHTFHSRCIDQWIIKSQKCPMCRQKQTILEFIEKHKDPAKMKITQAGMEFLQSDAMKKPADEFMYDYSGHFNLFPLPQTKQSKTQEKDSNTESSENTKQEGDKNILESKNNCNNSISQKNEEEVEEESKSQSDVQDDLSAKSTETVPQNENDHFSEHKVPMMNCNSEGVHLPLNEQAHQRTTNNNCEFYFNNDELDSNICEEDRVNFDEQDISENQPSNGAVAQEPTSSFTQFKHFRSNNSQQTTQRIVIQENTNNQEINKENQPYYYQINKYNVNRKY